LPCVNKPQRNLPLSPCAHPHDKVLVTLGSSQGHYLAWRGFPRSFDSFSRIQPHCVALLPWRSPGRVRITRLFRESSSRTAVASGVTRDSDQNSPSGKRPARLQPGRRASASGPPSPGESSGDEREVAHVVERRSIGFRALLRATKSKQMQTKMLPQTKLLPQPSRS